MEIRKLVFRRPAKLLHPLNKLVGALALIFFTGVVEAQLCQTLRLGNVGERSEYSVAAANVDMTQAQGLLSMCDGNDPRTYDACRQVNRLLGYADVKLNEIFNVAADDNRKCWTCDPGAWANQNTLFGAAYRLSLLAGRYAAQTGDNTDAGNTVQNMRFWYEAHSQYCAPVQPSGTSRENIDAATGAVAWGQCSNSVDDDNDGPVDCDDIDCLLATECQSSPAACTFQGDWTMSWSGGRSGGGYPMQMNVAGSSVNGTYDPKNGRISGNLNGKVMNGKWWQTEPDGSIADGGFKIELNDTCDYWSGEWWDDSRRGTWKGWR